MSCRGLITLAISVGMLVAFALPAQAAVVETDGVSGVPHGKSGKVLRYADRTGGHLSNSVTIFADDADGPGDRCTETWIDYSTKPHEHFNPGVFVNCSGGERSVSGALTNDSRNVRGMGVVVCDVPNTPASPITRNRENCRGNLSAMYLHSRQKYEDFRVHASQSPSGVNIWMI